MLQHIDLSSADVRSLIRRRTIQLAGNRRLRIYGMLSCPSGKRMKIANRVFFSALLEATMAGYRPCARCLPKEYAAFQLRKKRVEISLCGHEF